MSQASNEPARYVLTFSAKGERGQTAAVTTLLEQHGAYIEEFAVFDDVFSGRFFLRTAFRLVGATDAALATLRGEYAALLTQFGQAEGNIYDMQRPTRVLLMVSKADHCLRDLLDQWRRGELDMDIVAVASNHPDLGLLPAAEGLPFHHLPITPETKPKQEAELLALIESTGAELVVLARYTGAFGRNMRTAGRPRHQHPSFVPPWLQGRAPLRSGTRPRGQADRRNCAFCNH